MAGQTIINLGTGGSVLNGQSGSTTSADSNDPVFLDWVDRNYVYLTGSSGNFLSVPDEAALDVTGDLDLRVQVSLDSWASASVNNLISKFDPTPSYLMWVNTAGTVSLYWHDGTVLRVATSTVATGLANEATKWIRATLDVNNGASGRDIKFFMSDDGSTWTQLGSTITQSGVTSIAATTSPIGIGQGSGTFASGKIFRAQVLNGIDGTTVLNVDTSVITSGAATSFTATTGQTVTINRSTAGRKSVAVVSPVWLFGTDDYMQVADNDLLDFNASASFTALAIVRQWATPASSGRYISKLPSGTSAGWHVSSNSTDLRPQAFLASGPSTFLGNTYPTTFSAGSLQVVGVQVNRSTALLYSISGGVRTSSPTSTAGFGSLANTYPFNIGRNIGGGGVQDFELLGVAVFRRALSDSEIASVQTYYQARLS